MAKYNHVHKYQRTTLGKNYKIFKCMLPNCAHYIREELARNKLTICWRCGKTILIDYAAWMLEKPHCTDCKKPMGFGRNKPVKPKISTDRLKELLEGDILDKIK